MHTINNLARELAKQYNQVIIGSKCTNNCSYCFLKSMPAGLEVIRVPERTLSDIRETITHLDPDAGDVYIGECSKQYVQRIIYGDIASRADFLHIVRSVRDHCKKAVIYISSTNGTNLTESVLEELNALGRVDLYIHACSHRKETVEQYMSSGSAELLDILPVLQKFPNISFSISFVALPHLIPWSEIRDSVLTFQAMGLRSIPMQLYAYTDYSPESMKLDSIKRSQLFDEYREFVRSLIRELTIPAIFFPVLEEYFVYAPSKGVLPAYTLESININRCLAPVRDKDYLIFCSETAYRHLQKYLKKYDMSEHLRPVSCKRFGGNIVSGGLLTVDDFVREIQQNPCDIAVIPDTPFNEEGIDMFGRHYREIGQATHREVLVIKSVFFDLLGKYGYHDQKE